MSKDKIVLVIILLITLFGLYLRQKSLTAFYLYPDSYRYLLQAQKIVELQPISSGEGAIHFGYSLLSAIISFFTKNIEKAAYTVSFSTGVLAIPLVYFLSQAFFRSQKIGVLASLIFAGSFNHSAWSGFVLSETPAIFFLIMSWILLKKQKPFLAGLAQVISISCRIEYALLVLPTWAFFLSSQRKFSKTSALDRQVANPAYLLGLGLPILILVLVINPNISLVQKITSYQLAIVSSLALSLLCLVSKSKSWPDQMTNRLAKLAKFGLLSLLIYSVLLIPTRAIGKPFVSDLWMLKGWGDFTLSDPLLVFLGIAGLSLTIRKIPRIGFFFLASTLPLFFAYQQTNPVSHRYLVHLTPVLAIGAGYFTLKGFEWLHAVGKQLTPIVVNPAFSLMISLFLFGLLLPVKFVSANWHPEENYERLAAYRVQKIIQARKLSAEAILITFSVAPYSFYTELPVKKITRTPPYLSFKNIDSSAELALVIVDEAVRDQRPEFTHFAEDNLKTFLIEKSTIKATYLYANYRYRPERPIEIYLLPITELKSLLI